jgi:SAM-dependent methyltransferase
LTHLRGIGYYRRFMGSFFDGTYRNLVHRPDGRFWWHSMPLPDGDRIAGAHHDHNVQLKLWENLGLKTPELAGRRVLDIGANDGFFTIAALLSGAGEVTAINTADWPTYPHNIVYASRQWAVAPKIVVGDFQVHQFECRYDVIFFLGVLYHLENIFAGMRRLHELLKDSGSLYVETQMSLIESSLPIYEGASDFYPTVAIQGRRSLRATGISNFLFPNDSAMQNLARSYDFTCERLRGTYTSDYPSRGVFRLTKLVDEARKSSSPASHAPR